MKKKINWVSVAIEIVRLLLATLAGGAAGANL